MELSELRSKLREFARIRDWEQFHNPKNLAMALGVEAGELLEIFQWLTEKQAMDLSRSEAELERVGQELADILMYLVRLADVLGVDLESVTETKLAHNVERYPIDLARDQARKLGNADS